MDNEAKMILDDAVAFCERDGVDRRMIGMLSQSNPLELGEDSLSIEAPSKFAYSYLMKNRSLIERYLEESAFMPLSLNLLPPAVDKRGGSSEEAKASRETAVMRTARQEDLIPASSEQEAVPAINPFPARVQTRSSKEPAGGVNVVNTITASDLLKLRNSVNDAPARTRGEGGDGRDTNPRMEDGGGVKGHKVHSKFTFENFVYGNENKLAYTSAVRFAAMADEPDGYTSLFIYGNSGLGKTHLLLAIKNYLTENKPYLRVKYANSQAYIDDYINELRLQKTENRAIMREYHNADILIIDDIQNIIGKTASIEYFFQLMDEFIRSNKKIAIASDRAPKNLGMDERITSRFNAGSLCLVSEPSFEMKYEILKRYYENNVRHEPAGDEDVDGDSLLLSLPASGGTLTDEQLDHMAQVSGNNIRELESFCERCAGESAERELEGKILTSEDIDRIANEYFDTAHKKVSVDTVQRVVEEFYHVSHEDLIGPRRTANIVFARHVATTLALEMCEMTTSMVGAAFGGRDHSTVLNSIKVIEKKQKQDRTLVEDLKQLRDKIRMKS